jgi:DNA-binding response OmpR family regulator
MKILVAEDDAVTLALILHQLKKDNYEVFAAGDGKEALEMLSNCQPDLILTDILMPHTSGLELIGIVRAEQSRKIPIIVLSSIGEESVVMEAFALGADDYLSKPINVTELSTRVKRLLTPAKK